MLLVYGEDEKVAIDGSATAGYLGAASTDGVLRSDNTLSYTDGGDYITLSVDESNMKEITVVFQGLKMMITLNMLYLQEEMEILSRLTKSMLLMRQDLSFTMMMGMGSLSKMGGMWGLAPPNPTTTCKSKAQSRVMTTTQEMELKEQLLLLMA